MTGCDSTALLRGGQSYFDALVHEAVERRRVGWDVHELLACLVELSHAQYRALLSLAGAKQIPDQLKVERPHEAERKKKDRKVVSWRELQRMVS
jgi:hypothetical protein